MTLVLRNVRPWGGAPVDVALSQGRVAEIAPGMPRASEEIDGQGDLLLPGLHDHHLHILALAARRESVDLTGLVTAGTVRAALTGVAARAGWIRAVGYDERAVGLPDTAQLDRWVADRPLRLQDRTGALWVLNSVAMARLAAHDLPKGAERDAVGRPTGRFWREDQWLASALPRGRPDLAALGNDLGRLGLTALTDATAHNGPTEARLLVGAMPQRLTLMGSEALVEGDGFVRGPLKLLIDERDPPDIDALAARILIARAQGRAVAAHCVTETELALFLAGLTEAGGARAGDRIEHGGIISGQAIGVIAERGLTVVTNPAFIHDRGDLAVSAQKAFEMVREKSPQFGGLMPGGWEDFVPLQPADMVAYDIFKRFNKRYAGADQIRKSLQRLVDQGTPIIAGCVEQVVGSGDCKSPVSALKVRFLPHPPISGPVAERHMRLAQNE